MAIFLGQDEKVINKNRSNYRLHMIHEESRFMAWQFCKYRFALFCVMSLAVPLQSKNLVTVDFRAKMDPATQRTTLWQNGDEKMNKNRMAMNYVRQQDLASFLGQINFKLSLECNTQYLLKEQSIASCCCCSFRRCCWFYISFFLLHGFALPFHMINCVCSVWNLICVFFTLFHANIP